MANHRHRHHHHHHHKALIKHCLMKLSSALQLTCIQTLRRNNNTIGPVKIKYTQWQIKLKALSLKVVKIEVIYSNHWVKSKVFRWCLECVFVGKAKACSWHHKVPTRCRVESHVMTTPTKFYNVGWCCTVIDVIQTSMYRVWTECG